jgi:hypothetical protein
MVSSTFNGGSSGQIGPESPVVSARWRAMRSSLLAIGLVLSGIALSNTILALQHAWVDSPSWHDSLVSLALSGFGLALIWRGLRVPDPAASILGYAGGALLWMGFFEWTWRNFTVWLGIEPLMINGAPALPGSFLLIQATVCLFIPLTLLIAVNKDTRCRMMLWVRRRLGLEIPDSRGERSTPHPARVSATETIFIIWFIYLLNISLYDPRLIGSSSELYLAALALLGGWLLFLVPRLFRIPQAGLSIRYAIPTAYLMSILIDGATLTGLFSAYWIQPIQFPYFATAMILLFATCVYGLCQPPAALQRQAAWR